MLNFIRLFSFSVTPEFRAVLRCEINHVVLIKYRLLKLLICFQKTVKLFKTNKTALKNA